MLSPYYYHHISVFSVGAIDVNAKTLILHFVCRNLGQMSADIRSKQAIYRQQHNVSSCCSARHKPQICPHHLERARLQSARLHRLFGEPLGTALPSDRVGEKCIIVS